MSLHPGDLLTEIPLQAARGPAGPVTRVCPQSETEPCASSANSGGLGRGQSHLVFQTLKLLGQASLCVLAAQFSKVVPPFLLIRLTCLEQVLVVAPCELRLSSPQGRGGLLNERSPNPTCRRRHKAFSREARPMARSRRAGSPMCHRIPGAAEGRCGRWHRWHGPIPIAGAEQPLALRISWHGCRPAGSGSAMACAPRPVMAVGWRGSLYAGGSPGTSSAPLPIWPARWKARSPMGRWAADPAVPVLVGVCRPMRLARAAARIGRMPAQQGMAAPVYQQLADVLEQLGRLGEVMP